MKKFVSLLLCCGIIASSLVLAACGGENGGESAANTFEVTLSVQCEILLDNMHLLDRDLHELVPSDGVIFPETVVTVREGESVFDVLQREMRNAGIHMSFERMPAFDAVFVVAVNNLPPIASEPMSGWQFLVNGESFDVGASAYILQPNDTVEWLFALDLSLYW